MNETSSPSEIVQAHCNGCGGSRKSFLRSSYAKHDLEEESGIDWWFTYEVLECCGCSDIVVRHQYLYSEIEIRTNYYPPALFRRLPKWLGEAEEIDDVLLEVLKEVYAALENDLLIVATAGTRILLERAMVLLLDGDFGGFGDKLKKMTDKGIIGGEDRKLLDKMTDAGNAASHRGFRPSRAELSTILDTIENLLQRKFVLQPAAALIQVPPRKQQR